MRRFRPLVFTKEKRIDDLLEASGYYLVKDFSLEADGADRTIIYERETVASIRVIRIRHESDKTSVLSYIKPKTDNLLEASVLDAAPISPAVMSLILKKVRKLGWS